MDTDFDAIVIGAGLAGLTAGGLLARTAARVLLIERNHAFGGAATTYRHTALTVEASLAVNGLWLASAFCGFGGFGGAMSAGAAAALAAEKSRRGN